MHSDDQRLDSQAGRGHSTLSRAVWYRNVLQSFVKRGDGDQFLHRKDEKYREKIRAKVNTYNVFVKLAAISQGILCYLAIAHKDLVWKTFGAWMKTIRKDLPPSGAVTSEALRESLSEFLQSNEDPFSFKKFLTEKSATYRAPPFQKKAA